MDDHRYTVRVLPSQSTCVKTKHKVPSLPPFFMPKFVSWLWSSWPSRTQRLDTAEGEHSSTRGTIRSQLGSWADAERRDGGPKQLIPALTLTHTPSLCETHTRTVGRRHESVFASTLYFLGVSDGAASRGRWRTGDGGGDKGLSVPGEKLSQLG